MGYRMGYRMGYIRALMGYRRVCEVVSPAHPKLDPPLARPDPTRPQSDPKPGPTRARPDPDPTRARPEPDPNPTRSPARPEPDPNPTRPRPDPSPTRARPEPDPKPGPTRVRPGQRELAIRSGIISVVAPSIPQSLWGACGSTVLPLRIVGGRAAAVDASPCRQGCSFWGERTVSNSYPVSAK